MNTYDVIVIGGGLGGLTAAAKLAKEGKSVMLIEQHSVPGGCATTFKRKGFLVEAGLHEMDGLDEGDLKRVIFSELGVFDRVEFIRIPEFYRIVTSRTDLVVPDNTEKAIDLFVKAFPEEEKGIRTFFRTIIALRSEVGRLPSNRLKMLLQMPVFPLLYPHLAVATNKALAVLFPLFALLHPSLLKGNFSTLGGFVDGIIQNEELKLALLANYPYYHDDPHTLSLMYYSMAQGSYYQGGGHFIKGGSQRLSDYLAGFITEHGGTVMLNATVTRIVVENGQAAGVAFKHRHDTEETIIKADTVIANAAVPLVEAMLPEPERALLSRKVAGLKPSLAWLSVYIGFKRDISVLNNQAYSTFITGEGVSSLKEGAPSKRMDFDKRGFVFVDYSRIDSGLGADGKSFGAICTVDYIDEWDGLDDEAYRRRKDDVAQTLIGRLEKVIPGIIEQIEYVEVGTARTVQRFTCNPGGVAAGYAQTPEQSGMLKRLPNRSPVPNLWFASAWSNPGGGFTGAIFSGWFCAKEILNSKS